MKKIFDNAEIELISLEIADIIATSNHLPFEGEDDII